jgi:hypothetical protein
LTVADTIESHSQHSIDLYWHFAAECVVRMSEHGAIVERDRIVCRLELPTGMYARLVTGCEDPPLGWHSRRFDSKAPATTIVASRLIKGNWQGQTRIHIELTS